MSKKILVIDDDAGIREVLTIVLHMAGFEVFELNNGYDVKEQVEKFHPDLILLDIMLGDVDGRDICKVLKNDLQTKEIPVIMISASHGRPEWSQKQCGADDFIAKPFDIDDLLNHVKLHTAA